jgi:hypothetical protein
MKYTPPVKLINMGVFQQAELLHGAIVKMPPQFGTFKQARKVLFYYAKLSNSTFFCLKNIVLSCVIEKWLILRFDRSEETPHHHQC